MKGTLIAVALFLLSGSTLAAQRATVFVTSVGAAYGLTDRSKDNQDTVTDLRNSIRKDRTPRRS